MGTRAGGSSVGAPVSGLTIEPIADVKRMRQIEELQMAIWGATPAWIVPAHMLYIVTESGGIALGAYLQGEPVGFVLGLLGRSGTTVYHASHMAGIHPEYRGRGIGAALKWAQRDQALAQGIDLMTWTFDPLEARNAHFNLHKLGALSRTYKEDVYGDLGDTLNRGLSSDRLVAEWWLHHPAPADRTVPPDVWTLLADDNDQPVLHLDGASMQPAFRVAAPRDIQHLKRRAPASAGAWRSAQRQALGWALAQGYLVCDFVDGAFILQRRESMSRGISQPAGDL